MHGVAITALTVLLRHYHTWMILDTHILSGLHGNAAVCGRVLRSVLRLPGVHGNAAVCGRVRDLVADVQSLSVLRCQSDGGIDSGRRMHRLVS